MRGLLHWLLASSLRAGPASAALALSRLFDVFGAALIALVAMRRGFMPALQSVAVAFPLMLIAGYFSGLGMLLSLAVLALWLPVLLLGLLLRRTGSLALMLQAGAGMVSTALAAWYVLDVEPLATVTAFLDGQILPLLENMEGRSTALSVEQKVALVRIAPAMMAAGSFAVITAALLVGRWWQAVAFNPGGFRQDFHRLRHGRSVALIVAALMLAAALTGQPVLSGFALTGAMALIFQGIALTHGVIAATGQPAIWLWGMYGLLVLLPLPATLLLAAAGGLDNWMDFRRLAGQDAMNTNE